MLSQKDLPLTLCSIVLILFYSGIYFPEVQFNGLRIGTTEADVGDFSIGHYLSKIQLL